MNRLLSLTGFLLLITTLCTAQQYDRCMEVVSSSGGSGQQSNRSFVWTVGESIITTISGAGYSLTQGFHQPDPCGKSLTATSDLEDWGMSFFPNPTSDWLTVRFSPDKKGPLSASVFDMLGRPMLERQLLTSPEGSTIDATTWPPGVYFLLLRDLSTKTSTTIRFVKI